MTPAPMTLEQIRHLHDSMQRDLRRIEAMIERLESIPENATAEQMLKLMIDLQKENYSAQAEEIRNRLESLRPALANIILAAPVPGGARQ